MRRVELSSATCRCMTYTPCRTCQAWAALYQRMLLRRLLVRAMGLAR